MADRRAARAALLLPVGLAVLSVVSCGRMPGISHAAPADGGPPPPTSSAPSLAKLDPCTLLSPQDRSSAGLTGQGKPKTIGEARACDWTVPSTFGVTVTLDETNGLANLDLSDGKRTKKDVGSHQAVQVSRPRGACAVLLDVGGAQSVQVDVTNANFADSALACSRAGDVAGLLEPKLP
ncbi:DUF3558 domain-containing protein [Amycolatopsis sp. AA4]|uniref:DUF3558 family protein n=1 Tax=Actinomycetes TaxID=1760 RepID=UPI0001DEE669|nr:DUF3558 family protein [Amycolatopsis sp. AA4]ATY13278.1 DUF3558 domain-containing protein [Amycolatopsis sp. AA4]EFL09191.1 predicted protein [Streptomyces sp. AA4]